MNLEPIKNISRLEWLYVGLTAVCFTLLGQMAPTLTTTSGIVITCGLFLVIFSGAFAPIDSYLRCVPPCGVALLLVAIAGGVGP